MIIKKFQAQTEKEATLMAKEELGPDAIVMNIKTIKPKGIFSLFKKPRVELTAAIDENASEKKEAAKKQFAKAVEETPYKFGDDVFASSESEYAAETQNAIEEKINNIAKLLEQQLAAQKVEPEKKEQQEEDTEDKKPEEKAEEQKPKALDLIRNQLIENEVKENYADAIINELENQSDSQPIDSLLAYIYQKIVLKLGEVELVKCSENKPKIVFFVGNTGVGKTTTMAKLASKFKLEQKLDIAMFSLDTYRIAAIEQIKTYANILNTPMEVVYTPEEMRKLVEKYKDCDLIFVDTAGRSHKNKEQKNDLDSIIGSVKEYDCEILLVVSATTKYSDLKSIADVYGDLFDYKLVFTKLDETRGLGNILNLKLDTGKSLSYVTWGQNVPEDIGALNSQVIAKKLLGGAE
ncbi:MAG: flagellar biosynthesis protein FlhF [Clostridium sp.]|nr:flagellar biosynthesis protein FlhF [Clostridium sp.]MCM1207669.1 flagellar biosynthesis protein FlhF [Ruminococcus sp.]